MPAYRITGPDGVTYRVDAPNDEAVGLAVQQMFGKAPAAGENAPAPTPPGPVPLPFAASQPPPAPVSPQPSAPENTVMGVLGSGARGAREGLLDIVGLPGTLVDAATRPLYDAIYGADRPYEPFTLSGSGLNAAYDKGVNALAGLFGAPAPAPRPQTAPERVAERTGRELGAALVPGLGATATGARALAQGGVQAVRNLGPIARLFGAEQAVIAPGTFAAREGAAATAAGLGAGGAGEVTRAMEIPEGSLGHSAADIAGALGGVGTLALAGGALRGIKNAGDLLLGRGFPEAVQQNVTDVLVDAVGTPPLRRGGPVDTDPIVAAIGAGNRLDDVVPGFQESLADRLGSPGVAGLEYQRVGSGAPSFFQRRLQNEAAVNTAIESNAPTGTPGPFREALQTGRGMRSFRTPRRAGAGRAPKRRSRRQPATFRRGSRRMRGAPVSVKRLRMRLGVLGGRSKPCTPRSTPAR